MLWTRYRSLFSNLCRKEFCRKTFSTTVTKRCEPIGELSYFSFESEQKLQFTPIIILHGLLGSKQNWRGLGKAIAKKSGRHVYVLDARNHGDSPHSSEFSYDVMSADVKCFMNKHNIPRAILVGHSMGGRTVMKLSLTEAALIDKLVVVDVSPIQLPLSMSSVTPGYMLSMKQALENPKISNIGIVQARRAVDDYLSKTIPEAEIRMFLLTNLTEVNGTVKWKPNLDVLLQKFETEIFKFDTSANIFTGETLFICGEKSPYVNPKDYSQIRSIFPRAQFVIIPGAGHWVHSEKPSEFLEALFNFL